MLTLAQMKENRKLWVGALRSGKYVQTTGELCSNGGRFCCLGVLAVVSGYSKRDIRNEGNLMQFDGAKDFVGLADEEGAYTTESLAKLNDSGMSFAEIADIIESEPDGLFINQDSSDA